MDNFSDRQKYLLQIMGQISCNKLQHKMEEELRKGGYFHMEPKLIFGEEYEKIGEYLKKVLGWYHNVMIIFIVIDAVKF